MAQTFTVEGMTCEHCEMSVSEEVSDVSGVTSATADHKAGTVIVEGEGFDRDAVAAAVAEAGYKLV
ncbi:cation transporter [Corynebacterium sp. CCUG 65737]|uniref:heavy-metal-associated domain-containing protein n=1 Tax=Corynebacterium sp. CCUG 65737 TaxID=2823889 RepID=UPI00210B44D1|nr:heavy-metal-associated domain-containing protein [Corynebacterium sp. CCUG 65737]MCQ4626821.1 cation transporter [Corynebacterium sp. CCUG 65737]